MTKLKCAAYVSLMIYRFAKVVAIIMRTIEQKHDTVRYRYVSHNGGHSQIDQHCRNPDEVCKGLPCPLHHSPR